MPRSFDRMVRHFCITLWQDANGEPCFEPIDDVIDLESQLSEVEITCRGLRGRYFCWSLEDSRLDFVDKPPKQTRIGAKRAKARSEIEGGLHLHVYLECERTVRWSTVRNRFQRLWKGAHVEVKKGWRDTAREYHMGLLKGEEKPSHITHGEWGEWLEEHLGVEAVEDFAEEASLMIMEGATPRDVALRFPRWFLSRGHGVIRLWEVLHSASWASFFVEGAKGD